MYWDECVSLDDLDAARQQLVAKIVDKVFVYDRTVIGIALHGDFGIILENGEAAPMQIVGELSRIVNKTGAADASSDCTQIGSDGGRTRTGLVLLLACDDLLNRTIIGIVAKRIA